jgi:cell division protein FtsB
MIGSNKIDSKNYILIKNIFIKTCIFFAAAYFVFHFLNGSISLSPLSDKMQLVKQSSKILLEKEKELVFKELLVLKLNNSKENLDLLDELVRIKLGYSNQDEVVLSIE